MCDMKVDLDAVAKSFGQSVDAFEDDLASLAGLQADGIVRREGATLEMTETGKPLVRAVCAVFDHYLTTGEARHSKAV